MENRFAKKIELKFWDMIIPMLSNSAWLRAVAARVETMKRNENLEYILLVIIIGCVAFIGGFLVFSLNAIF